MRIAIFDYKVVSTNPIGGCHRRMLEGLCEEHTFTVFAAQFENPCPDRITWVRVPVPTRPLALLFLSFHVVAPLTYAWYRIRRRVSFDLVQVVESNLSFGHVAYVQFCHRAFLSKVWNKIGAKGLRGWFRWLDHWLHSLVEPWLYRRVSKLVVPSHGFHRELTEEYPVTAGKITVIPNPVSIAHMRRPSDFDSRAFRRRQGFAEGDVVLAFSALGHFERKGLPMLLEALTTTPTNVRLLVVGGNRDLVRAYRRRTADLGLAERVSFVGMVHDVRPYLWAADAFAFPSFYETFSLAAHEAAGAELPIIATSVHGIDEFLCAGESGFTAAKNSRSVAEAISRFLALLPVERSEMGVRAREAVQEYTVEQFVGAWRQFYSAWTY
jgi:glycosyltransferase involved in cell wall biosynthesis